MDWLSAVGVVAVGVEGVSDIGTGCGCVWEGFADVEWCPPDCKAGSGLVHPGGQAGVHGLGLAVAAAARGHAFKEFVAWEWLVDQIDSHDVGFVFYLVGKRSHPIAIQVDCTAALRHWDLGPPVIPLLQGTRREIIRSPADSGLDFFGCSRRECGRFGRRCPARHSPEDVLMEVEQHP